MNIIEFQSNNTKIIQNRSTPRENHDNHKTHRIPIENKKTNENHRIH